MRQNWIDAPRSAEKRRKKKLTFTPFFVEVDDLIHKLHSREALPLRLSDPLRIMTLLHSEQVDIQHPVNNKNTPFVPNSGLQKHQQHQSFKDEELKRLFACCTSQL
jgi:hypothetical protein